MKTCSRCKKELPQTSEYFSRKKKKDGSPGWYSHCKECVRDSQIKRFYGITRDQYNHHLVNQSDRCAICMTDDKGRHGYWCVDHDHETGKVRGLLCDNCNRGIGLLGDEPLNLVAAAGYLSD